MQYNKSEFLIETEVPEDEIIISRTNLIGVITYVNETFAEISGYEREELIGKEHNIVRHPDMPKKIFSELWQSLKREGRWSGIVKNMRKDGGFYWVRATISGVYKERKLVEYKSLRLPITYEEKLQAQKEYDMMRKEYGETIRTITYE